jgi:hypothetical protein
MVWFIGLIIALFCYLSSLMSGCFVRTKIEEKKFSVADIKQN